MAKKIWTAEEVDKLLKLAKMADVLSLSMLATIKPDEENNIELGDVLIDKTPGPHEILEENQRRENLLTYIDGLSPREIRVIKLRYGLDDAKPKTLDEVAKMYVLTRERIRQIEVRAIAKLRWRIMVKDKCRNIDDF